MLKWDQRGAKAKKHYFTKISKNFVFSICSQMLPRHTESFHGKTKLLPGHTELFPGHTTWRRGGQTDRLGVGLGGLERHLGDQ